MSSLLSKIFYFFILIVISVTGLFLYIQYTGTDLLSQNTLREKTGDISGVVIPSTEIIPPAPTTTNEILSMEKVPKIETSTTTVTNTQQLTEIDANEIDTRTTAQKPSPCITPIMYTLGTFDSRFGISKNYFLKTISDSVILWNNATSKQLFEYVPEGGTSTLAINLIYDVRQENTDNNKLLGLEIENTKAAAIALKNEYKAMETLFSEKKDEYVKKVEDFNARQKTYNDTVASWNEKGGAPQQEYTALITEKESLQKESDSLALLHNELTALLADINTKINKYNELVAFANERVNINNSTARKKFTEGNYSPRTNSITIYQFSDDIKLRRVLTHELGHALGLDHAKSKSSIMYAVNSATTTNLSSEDVKEVQSICEGN